MARGGVLGRRCAGVVAVVISFTIPIRSPSLPNLRESWQAKHRRAKKQKGDTRLLCPRWNTGAAVTVRLTRVGAKELDEDNLWASMKHVIDGLASWLKVDDKSPLVEWCVRQEVGEPEIRVDVYATGVHGLEP
jgi:hypothetical protein